MIITLSGKPGSGKSTIGQRLAQALGVPFYDVGQLRRQLATERALSLEQLNALGERERWTDQQVDDYQRALGQSGQDFVITGRTSFHFLPQSLKIFLDVSPAVGAERILQALAAGERPPEGEATDLATVRALLDRRVASDIRRYQQYYGIANVYDPAHFDVIVDTTNLTRDQVFERVMNECRHRGVLELRMKNEK